MPSLTPPPADAVWLELKPDPVLAFLHRPEPTSARTTAVLFCPSFGWEEMCSYRGRRAWAQELAQAGYPCARITLPGTGDSGGSPRDPARLEAWTAAVAAAAEWLRAVCGAQRVAALGIGLGGMLACLAADREAPIDDLILWGVPASGRGLLRELRAYARVVGARYPEDTPAESPAHSDLELIGFLMTRETASAIEALELRAPDPNGAAPRRALLLGRDGMSVDKRLRGRFEQRGIEVTVEEGAGYSTLMDHPQEAKSPAETIRTTIAWLSAGSHEAGQAPCAPTAAPHVATVAQIGAARVRETPLTFSGDLAGAFAILAESPDSDRAPLCAVWLNGGALHHIGPNRAWVDIARRWAARGVPTVRVDFPGLGESAGDDHRPLPDRSLYVRERIEQTLALLDQLAEAGLPSRFILGGLCSGAYWSLHAALADPRVVGAMLINLYGFFWSAELVAERETERSLDALQGRAWQRLVRGQLSGSQIRKGIGALTLPRLRGSTSRPVQRAQSAQIERTLEHLRDQGTETLLLFSRGEGLYEQLQRQGVLDRLDRWPNLSVEQLSTRDHLFRALSRQRDLHRALDRALERLLVTKLVDKPAHCR